MAKARIYNTVEPHKRGNTDHAYGFAADLRSRIGSKVQRMFVADMKELGIWDFMPKDKFNWTDREQRTYAWRTRRFRAWWKKNWEREHEFELVIRGRVYRVTITPGEGFIVAMDMMTARVVCVMPKTPNAHILNKWAIKYPE